MWAETDSVDSAAMEHEHGQVDMKNATPNGGAWLPWKFDIYIPDG
jgi:hypothetical protein